MTSKPESRLQLKIQRRLKRTFKKSFWFKVHGGPYQEAGIPDLLGCVRGKFIALEVKMPDGEEPTDLQTQQMIRIRQAKGCATVVTSEQEAVDAVFGALGLPKADS